MITVLRRFLVLLAVLFWQGGFTFYSAVVIHVGSDVLGSHLDQGFVTRSVTNYLNLAGTVALVVWAWDIASSRDASAWRRWLRAALWVLLLASLGVLAWWHVRLDDLLDVASHSILDPTRFRTLHSWYLHISTIQWAASLGLLAVTVAAWRGEDQRARSSVHPPPG